MRKSEKTSARKPGNPHPRVIPATQSDATNLISSSRRKFLTRIGGAGAAACTLAAAGLEPLKAFATAEGNALPLGGNRVQNALNLRVETAQRDSRIPVPPHTTNGDLRRYPDHSASYSKGLKQDDIGVVNPAAWASFVQALRSGANSDFEAIIIGGTHTLNGPQGAYAYDLETADSVQFGDAPGIGDPGGPSLVPPFARIDSPDYGTQLTEMY